MAIRANASESAAEILFTFPQTEVSPKDGILTLLRSRLASSNNEAIFAGFLVRWAVSSVGENYHNNFLMNIFGVVNEYSHSVTRRFTKHASHERLVTVDGGRIFTNTWQVELDGCRVVLPRGPLSVGWT